MTTIMPRIESIYDPGKPDRIKEDGDFNNHPFLGLIDGHSAPHNPYDKENSPILFNELTGGQIVRKIIMTTFCQANPDISLEFLAKEANRKIQGFMQACQIPIDDPGQLPGASVVLGKICEDHIEIIQAGDCYAIWLYECGEIGITKNLYYPYDRKAIENFARLKNQYKEDEKRIWQEHAPFLAELKRRHANVDYPILNGQELFEEWRQKIEIPLKGLKLLILLTDGCIPSKQMRDKRGLAKNIINLYQSLHFPAMTGLARIIHAAREIEDSNAKTSHEKHAEATAMALTFS